MSEAERVRRLVHGDELRRLELLEEQSDSGRAHIAASVRRCVSWRRMGGRYLSSCCTSRMGRLVAME